MWHLARIHLRGVGHTDARFDPLELDLTADGAPCDTVWWLENGGGKTSLLSLVFSVLRPARREFLGKDNDRTLGDYVQSGDVGHVVLEWRLPADGLPGISTDSVLITGMTLEWDDLRAQPHNLAALQRTWWGFRTTRSDAISQLPFDDEAGRPRRAKVFADQLAREIGQDAAAQLHRPADNQRRWHEWLENHQLDPEVFRYQIEMNADEGAIADQFTFSSGDAFVEWALKVAADPQLPASVSSALTGVAERIRNKPALELELQLCDGAAGHLSNLAAAQELIVESASRLKVARDDAGMLAARLQAGVTDAERTAELEREAQKAAEERARQARTEAGQQERASARWMQLAANADLVEATKAHEGARKALAEAELAVRGWQLAEQLAAQDELRSRKDAFEQQLERFEEGLVPLKEQLAAAQAQVAARAAHGTATIVREVDEGANELAQLEEDAKAEKARRAELHDDEQDAQTRRADAQALLTRADQVHQQAVEQGLLDDGQDPTQAAESAAADVERFVGQVDDAKGRRARAEEHVDTCEQKLADAKGKVRETRAAAQEAVTRQQQMDAQADELARTDELIVATQTEPADVWSQPQRVRERLHQLTDDARRDVIDLQLHTVEVERIVEALETDGYAPPSADVTDALARLREANVPAVAGYRYLADAVSVDARANALRAAPDVSAGIVVSDAGQLEKAAQVLAGMVPNLPLTLGTRAALTDGDVDAARRVVPPDPAVYDQQAAAELSGRVTEEQTRLAHELDSARQRVAKLGEVHATFDALHRTWPDPEGVRDAVDTTATALQEAEEALGETAGEHERALEERATARTRLGELQERQLAATDLYRALKALADVWSQRAEAETALQDAKERLQECERERDLLDEQAQTRTEQQTALRERRTHLEGERRQIAGLLRRNGLEAADANAVADPGGTLETLEEALQRHRNELLRVRTEEGLARQLEEVETDLAEVSTEVDLATDEVAATARTLLESADGQDRLSRRAALEAADAQVRRQVERKSKEHSRLEQATKDEKQAAARARELHAGELPDGTIVPAAAQDRRRHAQAADRRAQQLNRERGQHREAADGHDKGAQAAASRAQMLQQSLGHLAATPAPHGATASPFDGTTAEADEQVRDLRARIEEANGQQQLATTEREQAHSTLTRLVRSGQYTTLLGEGAPVSRIADRLTGDDAAVVAADAAKLERELQRRASTIRADLEQVAQHRQLLVDQLSGLAKDALKLLAAIRNRSRMPDNLEGWSGRRFLDIRHDPLPDDPAAVADRIGRVVDHLIEQQTTPDGHQLLYRVTRAAVGDSPFKVHIIKPHGDLHYERADITELTRFSGGQKVTAAIALFATMLNMRADGQTSRRSGNCTTLLLDNPFGKSSSIKFVQLQCEVAARLGVQLIYTTAVQDLGALSEFRRVIRLERRRNRRNDALHLVERESSSLAEASLTRGDPPIGVHAGGEPAA
jgi:DNA repair exonuclease SbcCD ATPase subunit